MSTSWTVISSDVIIFGLCGSNFDETGRRFLVNFSGPGSGLGGQLAFVVLALIIAALDQQVL